MHSYIRPDQFVAICLPSDQTRIVKVIPDTIVQLGKYGSFPANQILGRPFYVTYELLDSPESDGHQLRAVTATELHTETLIAEGEADGEGEDLEMGGDGIPMRTNRETFDDSSSQRLTVQEIEELKQEASGSGREIVAKILESHSALDQKTAFSLAKYTLRKRKKYIRRFTVLPMDVGLLTNYMLEERDAQRTMELRDEHIGLIGCWGNVHHSGDATFNSISTVQPNGRYLVVDETGGLVVAAMAERMGILYPHDGEEDSVDEQDPPPGDNGGETRETEVPTKSRRNRRVPMSASGNTITVIHAYSQPNLSLLKYFGYDTNNPDESHPLHTHLKTVSWMQLVDPSADPIYSNEPPVIPATELASLKQNKRATYYHKRTRWERVKRVVDEARAGDFDGLVVATLLEPPGVLKNLVPLLAGSASVAVYSPTVEPLVHLMDMYSTARRTAFINRKRDLEAQNDGTVDLSQLDEEFEVDPTQLLPPTLQTSRVRPWQVLPGRTHPLMTGRGGAEGYLFHGIRVVPTTVHIQAAGAVRKRRKVATSTPASDRDVDMAP
ncbi:hypothetical protein NUU61_001658 [Penicillium alfredii]|uniref:tRNA (adenine(58)-N(1))-methyltransferase non-catalytic subunit TRM6 n=1 Tax=Penicillium alfredii TaxID=1506179 RepID=A0A9W9KFX3_9EURO|nr:uncharacterized protein NUU61_001658 [Penicillium alfredii]KAJ5104311.1 hypothetical protein NUU61_001658 [Penicillium alfredii]